LAPVDSPLARYLKKSLAIPDLIGGSAHGVLAQNGNGQVVVTPGILAYGGSNAGDAWEASLAHRYRMAGKPSIDPLSDASIQEVIRSAEAYTARITSAILNTSNVIDNPNSRELRAILEIGTVDEKLFTVNDVLSTARHIMIHLVHRCIAGYTDFKNCENVKAMKEDLDLTCAERPTA
jgi:hypothetical protein